MKTNQGTGYIEFLVIIIAGMFLFGCIASSYKTAKTVEKKQVALSGGYMHLTNLDNSSADGINLIDLNLRYGVAKGFDMGLANTFDVSSGSGTSLSTLWGDFKLQLSNRDNEIGKPIVSLGLTKGYVYDPQVHLTSFPVMLSIPLSDRITPTFQYRYTLARDEFLPTTFEDPRHEFSFGLEYSFSKPNLDEWTPKIGFAIGTFNSLAGGEGDNGLILNFGLTLESPVGH